MTEDHVAPSHQETEAFDVAVIGAGPVGKMAALLLGRAGHSVLLADRKAEDYPLPRAVGHDAEIARLLQRAGLPPDRLADAVEPYDELYMWLNGAGEILQEIDVSGIGTSAWNNAYFYHQPALERHIARAIAERPEIETRRAVDARVVGQDADGVTIALAPVGGSVSTTVRARYVIGADGANSPTRRDAGIAWHDLGYFFDWLVVDVLPHEGVELSRLAIQVCDPARPTTMVPSGPGRRRWEFMLLDGEDPRRLEEPEQIWRLLATWDVTPETADIERGVVYTFGAGWAERWRDGRVFLAGDAAHLMPPFAAQGLASGLRDVLNLSWKLDLALRGEASATLLDSYESERIAHVDDHIRFSIMLAQVSCITDPAVAAGRDAQMVEARRNRSAPEPPPDPRLGAGLRSGEHGGELSRQGLVTTATTPTPTRFDDLFGPGALIVRGDARALAPEDRMALARVGITVATFGGDASTFSDASGTYATWFDQWEVDAILVRPDFFVYGTVPVGGDLRTIADGYLQGVLSAA